jgi:hypothetical protein
MEKEKEVLEMTLGKYNHIRTPLAIKNMLKSASVDAVQLVIDTMNDAKEDKKVRLDCAKEIINRVMGKPLQPMDVQVEKAIKIVVSLDTEDEDIIDITPVDCEVEDG